MATESEADTSRAVVKTYVPAYQRDEWDDDADAMDMSRSEFVRCMVQAGRSDFDLDESNESGSSLDRSRDDSDSSSGSGGVDPSQEADTAVDGFEQSVLDALEEDGHRSWDDLLDEITDDIEQRLEETLQRHQSENVITYSGRHGGYTLEK